MSEDESAAKRWLRRLGLGFVCLAVMGGAALSAFPWDRLTDQVAQQIGLATGTQVQIGSLGPGLSWTGPWLVLREVAIQWPPSTTTLDLEHARLRPAWALSWLRLEPAVALDLLGPAGHVTGTVWPGQAPAFDGHIDDLNPTALPPALIGNVFPPITGQIDADLALASGGRRGVVGSVTLDAREGNLVIPNTPLAIPFDSLVGEMDIEEEGSASVRGLALKGPLVSISGEGTIGTGRETRRSPLDLAFQIDHIDPSMAPLLGTVGLNVDPENGGSFQIQGTLGDPRLRQR
ncbi:MAG: type II secretion system protein GspN [Myxococcota bacterium]|nr:type II secretion system protein GspN [Myxococcota bacterium]